jgi:hypothetical protein
MPRIHNCGIVLMAWHVNDQSRLPAFWSVFDGMITVIAPDGEQKTPRIVNNTAETSAPTGGKTPVMHSNISVRRSRA